MLKFLYLFNSRTLLGTGFDVENGSYFFKELMCLFRSYLSSLFKISFCADKEKDNFFMTMLSYFTEPASESFQRGLLDNGESKENTCNSFVEGSNDSFESLLPGLNISTFTVSQICSLTYFLSPTVIFLVANSTPTVT